MANEKPLVLNKTQLHLAIEIGAQQAAQKEVARQIRDALEAEGIRVVGDITVNGCAINMMLPENDGYPDLTVLGRPVVWE